MWSDQEIGIIPIKGLQSNKRKRLFTIKSSVFKEHAIYFKHKKVASAQFLNPP